MMLRSRICRLHFETDKVLWTYFVRCDMNDVTIPHAFVLRKNIVYYVIGFREVWYVFRKPQCGDPEHPITLCTCEIYIIKTEKIDGYIINIYYNNSNLIRIMSSWQERITRSNETLSVEFDLVIRACQRDVIRHFGSSYCCNDIIYPSHVIENFEMNI